MDRYKVILRIVIAAISSLLIASCSSSGGSQSDPKDNVGTKQIDPDSQDRVGYSSKTRTSKPGSYKSPPPKPLDLPPDLLGTSNEAVAENYTNQQQYVVLPEVTAARIVDDENGKRWMEVDADAQTVWKTVTEYWAASGITLAEFNPGAGTMETEWIDKSAQYDEDGSMWKNLAVSLFSTVTEGRTSFDKYRIRLERLDGNRPAMYVTHRATAKKEVFYPRRDTEYDWVEEESDPDRIADLLQSMLVYFDDYASAGLTNAS